MENPEHSQIVEFSKFKTEDCGFVADQIPGSDIDITVWGNYDPWENLKGITNDPYVDIIVAGEKAVKYSFTEKSELPNTQASRIYFNHNRKGFLIFLKQLDKKGNYDPIYDQILPTFKFIN